MSHSIEIDLPEGLERFRLPPGVERRLHELLDKQEREGLSAEERKEAEGLVELSDLLSLLKARARSVAPPATE